MRRSLMTTATASQRCYQIAPGLTPQVYSADTVAVPQGGGAELDHAVEAAEMLLPISLAEMCNHKHKALQGKAAHARDRSRQPSGMPPALLTRRYQIQKEVMSRLAAPAQRPTDA